MQTAWLDFIHFYTVAMGLIETPQFNTFLSMFGNGSSVVHPIYLFFTAVNLILICFCSNGFSSFDSDKVLISMAAI